MSYVVEVVVAGTEKKLLKFSRLERTDVARSSLPRCLKVKDVREEEDKIFLLKN